MAVLIKAEALIDEQNKEIGRKNRKILSESVDSFELSFLSSFFSFFSFLEKKVKTQDV